MKFNLKSDFQPCGDQPQAIQKLIEGIRHQKKFQTLLGVTGSGKTFTMAHVIEQVQKPTLVMAPNKTLAAQLYMEFKSFFPENAVHYFVSYYDYYQPEAYIPRTDVYIEKDSAINEDIDKLRHAATHALLTCNDVIIVASVSCIYGLGSPEAYHGMLIDVQRGKNISREAIIKKLVQIQYERNDVDFHRGVFRSRGDVLDIFPAYEEEVAIRIEFVDDAIEKIATFDPLTGKILEPLDRVAVYPASHFVAPESEKLRAIEAIKKELREQCALFEKENKLLEQQRLEQRTQYDLEMIQEMGFCKGIENYSRHFDGRAAGEPPPTLFQYFPKDFLLIVDESHVTIPQIGGMYKGDRSRKETLVDYGFRLPSALDNRPLTFEEFEAGLSQTIFVSATPSEYEIRQSQNRVVEQIIRPTGLIDPQITVKPVTHQVDDLIAEVRKIIDKKERVLVTTLTKRMAENLAKYLTEVGIKCRYLHADIETVERFQILRELRQGVFDVLIGINLLREGLDLPEVSLVAILDGDKEGFLRSTRSLVQTFGRAARNVNGRVIVYADVMTGSLKAAMHETDRRRALQLKYNQENKITPKTIIKAIRDGLFEPVEADYLDPDRTIGEVPENIAVKNIPRIIAKLKKQMEACARRMQFEEAAKMRDEIRRLREVGLSVGGSV